MCLVPWPFWVSGKRETQRYLALPPARVQVRGTLPVLTEVPGNACKPLVRVQAPSLASFHTVWSVSNPRNLPDGAPSGQVPGSARCSRQERRRLEQCQAKVQASTCVPLYCRHTHCIHRYLLRQGTHAQRRPLSYPFPLCNSCTTSHTYKIKQEKKIDTQRIPIIPSFSASDRLGDTLAGGSGPLLLHQTWWWAIFSFPASTTTTVHDSVPVEAVLVEALPP